MRIVWWVIGAALAAGCSGGGGAATSCPNDLPASCPAGAAGYQAAIAPLINAKCQPCHAPGGTSVHYLQTYAEVQNIQGAVLDQVYACKMPPPGYAPLTASERADLLGWLVCNAPDD